MGRTKRKTAMASPEEFLVDDEQSSRDIGSMKSSAATAAGTRTISTKNSINGKGIGSGRRRKSRRRRRGRQRRPREAKAEQQKQQSLERQIALQQQLCFLQWRKNQASARMRNILTESKKLRIEDEKQEEEVQDLEQKSSWIQSVIESEMQRPLEVDDSFIEKYRNDLNAEQERVAKDTQHHLDIVSRLKKDLIEKEHTRQRQALYKQRRSQLRMAGNSTLSSTMSRESGLSSVPDSSTGRSTSILAGRIEELDALEQNLRFQQKSRVRGASSPTMISPATDLYLLRMPHGMQISL